MICSDTDNYVNVLSTIKKEKKKKVNVELLQFQGRFIQTILSLACLKKSNQW